MRVAKARIAHSRGIDQRCNFGEVLGAELVENVGVRILELRQELDSITRSAFVLQLEVSRQALTMYFSRGESLDRSCAKERWKCVASLYAGGKRPFRVSGVSKL